MIISRKHENNKHKSIFNRYKKRTISAKFLGTLNDRNIIPPNGNSGTKIIDKNGKLVRYELLDEFSEKEISFLESQLAEAVDMVEKAIAELKDKSVLDLESMLDVFLNYDDIPRNKVIQKYSKILDVLKNKMRSVVKTFTKKNAKASTMFIYPQIASPSSQQSMISFLNATNFSTEFLHVQVGLYTKQAIFQA